jgi:hypothetical protein
MYATIDDAVDCLMSHAEHPEQTKYAFCLSPVREKKAVTMPASLAMVGGGAALGSIIGALRSKRRGRGAVNGAIYGGLAGGGLAAIVGASNQLTAPRPAEVRARRLLADSSPIVEADAVTQAVDRTIAIGKEIASRTARGADAIATNVAGPQWVGNAAMSAGLGAFVGASSPVLTSSVGQLARNRMDASLLRPSGSPSDARTAATRKFLASLVSADAPAKGVQTQATKLQSLSPQQLESLRALALRGRPQQPAKGPRQRVLQPTGTDSQAATAFRGYLKRILRNDTAANKETYLKAVRGGNTTAGQSFLSRLGTRLGYVDPFSEFAADKNYAKPDAAAKPRTATRRAVAGGLAGGLASFLGPSIVNATLPDYRVPEEYVPQYNPQTDLFTPVRD